ncbi:N-methyltryptophan oxidase [Sinomonas atrocyanea]|uniref:N-methyltryptophan oxidase n=1 Tax=Sinomonas atrocyanea TaxID=37927 RepID=A0A126ZUH0_9MICC|nr:N-methyl-L-tryptophan oxidase [Sinomonas atrocyanea]AMM30790.1 N-methyltryptophan oxidase [Sinomonas atrocyanea]GEB63836.1 N-methyltryptophan oxidase [Sinomonas atrocyanea]GGG65211.1 N-methyltryptophan oxidase [Sinomonas atrocyanea]
MSQEHYDVIVVGLGPWGSAAAWHLSSRGKSVLALDKFTPPHKEGSHGGATRLARQSSSAGEQYTAFTKRTFELWDRVAAETGTQILNRTGTLFVGEPGSLWFDRTIGSLQASDFEFDAIDAAAARRRFPWAQVSGAEVAVWEPNGTVALVEPGIRGLQTEARRHGAVLRTGEEVLEWDETPSGVLVRTDQGRYTADKLVVAVGSRANHLLQLDLPYKVARQVLANFRQPGPALPAVYFAKPPGSTEAPAYGCSEPNGDWKFSVPGKEDWIDPEDLTQDLRPGDLERILQVLRERMPGIDPEPQSTTVCMWAEVEDGHWVIGQHPQSSRVVIGTGDMGRGFRYAPAVGEMLADHVDEVPRPDTDLFLPSRFAAARA